MKELGPDKSCLHLSELKRIGMLLKLMEWPGFPADPSGGLFLANRPNTRYMRVQPQNEYRDRPVLPDPSKFGPLTGDAAPQGAPASDTTSPRSAATTQSSVDTSGSVAAQIKGLKGKGQISSVPAIVAQMAGIRDDKARRECAGMLVQWLRQVKMWDVEPHASASWRQHLEGYLNAGE